MSYRFLFRYGMNGFSKGALNGFAQDTGPAIRHGYDARCGYGSWSTRRARRSVEDQGVDRIVVGDSAVLCDDNPAGALVERKGKAVEVCAMHDDVGGIEGLVSVDDVRGLSGDGGADFRGQVAHEVGYLSA